MVHGQDLTFPFLELQGVPVNHFSSLWKEVQPSDISATPSIFVIRNLAESMLYLIIQEINEDTKYLSDIFTTGLISGIQYSDWALAELIVSLITKH